MGGELLARSRVCCVCSMCRALVSSVVPSADQTCRGELVKEAGGRRHGQVTAAQALGSPAGRRLLRDGPARAIRAPLSLPRQADRL